MSSIELFKLYPLIEIPQMTLRTNGLNKKQEKILEMALDEFIEENVDKSDPYIYQAILWLQDNFEGVRKISIQIQFQRKFNKKNNSLKS